MPKTEEGKLEKQVETFMNKKRIWQLGRYQASSNQFGLPDRLYLYKGYLLGLELKTDKGVPTDLQIRKIKTINDNGGVGVIIRSVSELEKLIKAVDCYASFTPDIDEKIRECFKELVEDDEL